LKCLHKPTKIQHQVQSGLHKPNHQIKRNHHVYMNLHLVWKDSVFRGQFVTHTLGQCRASWLCQLNWQESYHLYHSVHLFLEIIKEIIIWGKTNAKFSMWTKHNWQVALRKLFVDYNLFSWVKHLFHINGYILYLTEVIYFDRSFEQPRDISHWTCLKLSAKLT